MLSGGKLFSTITIIFRYILANISNMLVCIYIFMYKYRYVNIYTYTYMFYIHIVYT